MGDEPAPSEVIERIDDEWVAGIERYEPPRYYDNFEMHATGLVMWCDPGFVPFSMRVGEIVWEHQTELEPLLQMYQAARHYSLREHKVLRRPRRVRIADEKLASELRVALPDIEIVVAPTPEIDAFVIDVYRFRVEQQERLDQLTGYRIPDEPAPARTHRTPSRSRRRMRN